MKGRKLAVLAALVVVGVGLTGLGVAGCGGGGSSFRQAFPMVFVTGVTPATGPSVGGTAVTITGSGFQSGAVVSFDGAVATSVVVVSGTTITCVTPQGIPNAQATISVTSAGITGTLANAFLYTGPPQISSLSPDNGLPATTIGTVTINGVGFLVGVPATVTFGGVPATSVTVVSTTQITVVPPVNPTAGYVDVVVTQNGLSGTFTGGFLYGVPPAAVEFLTQPATLAQGATVATIQVRLVDTGGATFTLQSRTITIAADHPAGIAPGGTLSLSTVAGIASFQTLTFAQPGQAVTLIASSPGLTTATSMAFNVTSTAPAGVSAGTGRLFGLTSGGNLVSYDPGTRGGQRLNVAITGLGGGETVVGIDFRPVTGQLYALTNNAGAGRLYTVNRLTGAATQVGTGSFTLNGANFGFDFNPVVDRIRIVSDTTQNFRVNPNDGTAVMPLDANLTAGTVVGAAYINNFTGSVATTLFGIDTQNPDRLVTINPPNTGVVNNVGPLTVDSNDLVGFDIAGATTAYALLNIGGVPTLNSVNLGTGALTPIGAMDDTTIVDIASEPPVLFATTSTGALISFLGTNPAALLSAIRITGLQAGETIVGFDSRPSSGQLYLVGSTSRLYLLDPTTAAATAVGAVFGTALSGATFGVEFDPVNDVLLVMSNTGQSLSVNPNTGVVTANTNVAAGTAVSGLAASPNFPGAATTFTGIDAAADSFVTIVPSTGVVTPGPALTVDIDPGVAFEFGANGVGYAATKLAASGQHQLRIVTVAAVTTQALVGNFGSPLAITGLAIQTAPATFFLLTGGGALEERALVGGAVLTTLPVTGLVAGDALVGIDVRPATGALYALGVDSLATPTTVHLYTINPVTRVATQVGGNIALTQAVTGTTTATLNATFGFDFNPMVDRIRVVNAGQDNFRLNPDTGVPVGGDLALNPAGTEGHAAAYTNNAPGAASTTLYVIDCTSDLLNIQNPPNNGTLAAVGTGLGVNALAAAFDITRSGDPLAALTVGGVSGLYRIDLAAGTATLVYAFPGNPAIAGFSAR